MGLGFRGAITTDLADLLSVLDFSVVKEMIELYRNPTVERITVKGRGKDKVETTVIEKRALNNQQKIKILTEFLSYLYPKKKSIELDPFTGLGVLLKAQKNLANLSNADLLKLTEGQFSEADVLDVKAITDGEEEENRPES